VITYSFVDSRVNAQLSTEPALPLLNPIAAHMDVMRSTLWSGLIDSLQSNLRRKAARVRLFEMGRVFRADPAVQAGPLQVAGIAQPWRVAALASGSALPEQWGSAARKVDFFDLKGDLESLPGAGDFTYAAATHPALHPGRSARVLQGDEPVGWIGELHPALQQAFDLPVPVVLFELELSPMLSRPLPRHVDLSRFPPVFRDVALVVPVDMDASRVLSAIRTACAEAPDAAIVQQVELFDVYRGKGLENKEKSLAFRVRMQDTERTLSDAEAQHAILSLVSWLEQRIGARLRSAA
jgi:phenylalanyl-tRNA synthetase beta chain